jgi:hypothetical protein
MVTAERERLGEQLGSYTDEPQHQYFRITDSVPEQGWYWAAMASLVASAGFWLAGKHQWSTFVGHWPPTFLLLALFHKQIHPSR